METWILVSLLFILGGLIIFILGVLETKDEDDSSNTTPTSNTFTVTSRTYGSSIGEDDGEVDEVDDVD